MEILMTKEQLLVRYGELQDAIRKDVTGITEKQKEMDEIISALQDQEMNIPLWYQEILKGVCKLNDKEIALTVKYKHNISNLLVHFGKDVVVERLLQHEKIIDISDCLQGDSMPEIYGLYKIRKVSSISCKVVEDGYRIISIWWDRDSSLEDIRFLIRDIPKLNEDIQRTRTQLKELLDATKEIL